MVDLIDSPYSWLAAFFVGIFFCAWRMDKAVGRIGIKRSAEPDPTPRTIAQVRNVLVTAVLVIVGLYLLNETSFPIALIVLFAGSLYYWREAYKSRVLPLVTAGMPQSEVLVFTLMQWLWLGPLTVALALFVRGKYSAP
jgi:hypothetical protein